MYRLITLLCLSILPLAMGETNTAGQFNQVFQLPDKTFFENLHVLPDGKLLLSTFRTGNLLILDPAAANPVPSKVASLEGINGLTGIAPLENNVYAVTAGKNEYFSFIKGSMKLFVVSLDSGVLDAISVPDRQMLNGMAALPHEPHTILSADSIEGRIFRINTKNQKVGVAITDYALGPGTSSFKMGANGLKLRGDYLYFANSVQGTFKRRVASRQY
ncbi:hypothetical protein PT974_10114 [Cladobotryum mycophilum]|uniref:Uncharacterized protein n=1 Tax=Cladobotryum mycophilum TaxID=491253 RepID=A0ABR0S8X8_9HYPO